MTVGDFTFNWDFIRGRILGLDNLIKYDLNYLLIVIDCNLEIGTFN